MEIKYKDQTYDVDIEKAIQLGIVKRVGITRVETGDLFKFGHCTYGITVQVLAGVDQWALLGNDFVLQPYGGKLKTHAEMVEYLNTSTVSFVKNIRTFLPSISSLAKV